MVQPPTSFVKNSLRMQLASLAERTRVQSIRHHDPASTHGSVNDLRAKVQAWVDTMTPTQRSRRFTTNEVEQLAGLSGKQGGPAAHHRIAQALRACGFQPRRDWTRAGRNTRFWKLEERNHD
jgi:hypothetical protein